MAADCISARVQAFIAAHVHSIEQLEVLLFLRKASGGVGDPGSIAAHLRTSPGSVRRRLQDLEARGLIRKEGEADAYRYEPRTEELSAVVSELASVYETFRYRIIEMIFSRTRNNMQLFSDAFRLKGNKDDEDG